MNKKYSGFTLVEMLIVMGIIIILTVVGITAGRFATNRANDITHKNAVDQAYTSLQAYYTDHREYPVNSVAGVSCNTGTVCTFAKLVGDKNKEGLLVPYVDAKSFDGGSKATYFYGVGGDGGNQAVLACVTLRGQADENAKRDDGLIYCAGNGIGLDLQFEGGKSATVPAKEFSKDSTSSAGLWTTFSTGGSAWDNGWVELVTAQSL